MQMTFTVTVQVEPKEHRLLARSEEINREEISDLIEQQLESDALNGDLTIGSGQKFVISDWSVKGDGYSYTRQ